MYICQGCDTWLTRDECEIEEDGTLICPYCGAIEPKFYDEDYGRER